MSLPSITSDAGPLSRQLDPNETYYGCAGCGHSVTRGESYPCQGSDDCTARICESCKVQCAPCGLTCCPDHRTDVSGEITCHACMAGEVADGAAQLLEAQA